MLPKGFFNSSHFKSMLNNNSVLKSGVKRFFSYKPNFTSMKSMMNSKLSNQNTFNYTQKRNFARKFGDQVSNYIGNSRYPMYITIMLLNAGVFVSVLH